MDIRRKHRRYDGTPDNTRDERGLRPPQETQLYFERREMSSAINFGYTEKTYNNVTQG